MTAKMIPLFLITLAFSTIDGQSQSPCPGVFSYEPRGTEPDRWYGVILLNTDEELVGVWLHVILDRPSQLLGNWFGDVTTTDNREYTIRNNEYRLRAGPPTSVRFFVKYSDVEPIPSVTGIRLNGRSICPERTGSSHNRGTNTVTPETTKLQISHRPPTTTVRSTNNRRDTPRPQTHNAGTYGGSTNTIHEHSRPNMNSVSYGSSSQTVSSNNRPSAQEYPDSGSNRPSGGGNNRQEYDQEQGYQRTTTKRPHGSFEWITVSAPEKQNNQNSEEEDFFVSEIRPGRTPIIPAGMLGNKGGPSNYGLCGTVVAQPKPLITHGQKTSEGQWPWHAALYHSKGIDLTYICGASLISPNYVVTAAHCVTRKQSDRPVTADSLVAYLGKYNLRNWSNAGIQDIQISEVNVHPNYNATNFNSDIAVLKLIKTAQITDWVRPVCLWEESTELSTVLDREGTVVGWGYDETGRVTEELAQAKMPVVSQQTCIWSYPDFFSRFTSDRTYCAGFRNGTSVCNGDSGGGMVFPKQNGGSTTIWQIRGLVSISVALQDEFVCDSSHYVVFTDVAKHLDWIRRVMNK